MSNNIFFFQIFCIIYVHQGKLFCLRHNSNKNDYNSNAYEKVYKIKYNLPQVLF